MKIKTLEQKLELTRKQRKQREKKLMLKRFFEVRQSVAEAHAHRTCEECKQCESAYFCGWREGFFFEECRPDLLGVVVRGVQLDGDDVFLFRELRPGALDKPVVKGMARELNQFMPVIQVNTAEELVHDPDIDKEEPLVTL